MAPAWIASSLGKLFLPLPIAKDSRTNNSTQFYCFKMAQVKKMSQCKNGTVDIICLFDIQSTKHIFWSLPLKTQKLPASTSYQVTWPMRRQWLRYQIAVATCRNVGSTLVPSSRTPKAHPINISRGEGVKGKRTWEKWSVCWDFS